jgi:hypothetical protein
MLPKDEEKRERIRKKLEDIRKRQDVEDAVAVFNGQVEIIYIKKKGEYTYTPA